VTDRLSAGITTLLCDADGNLFPSEEPAFVASAAVTNDFLAEIGVSRRFGAEELRLATTGKNFRTTAVDLARESGVPLGGSVLTAPVLEHWVDEERRRVSDHLATALVPDAAIRDPLTRLAKRFELAAVSSSATPRLLACLTATALTDLFPAGRVFSAEDSLPTPTSKPDPAIYLHACERLGVSPSAALAVEDSIPGATSAVRAGIRTVGNVQFVAESERDERRELLLAAGVVTIVSSWSELEELLSAAA
jgi:beta-phosphoglucomutase-like phosphatase (HAD superfamily)